MSKPTQEPKPMAKFDPYQVITDTLIASIEEGTPAWRCGWKKLGGALTRPVSGGSGNPYNGINVLLLWGSAQAQGFHSDTWHTYKGAKGKGGQVRKGEKGSRIIKWLFFPLKDTVTRQVKLDSNGEPMTFGKMRLYTVFNACQIEWEEGSEYAPGPVPTVEDHDGHEAGDNYDEAKVIFDAWATEVEVRHGGDRAFYRPAADHITGHSSRLNRKAKRKGSYKEAYAFEELIAELGAAFLCADAGISQPEEPRADHASYLASWLKVLKDDPKAIVKAASRAEKAAKLVLAKAAEAEQQMAAK